jgi:hypothetical protein
MRSRFKTVSCARAPVSSPAHAEHIRRSRPSERLLDRILETPQLARVVPQLQPKSSTG